MNYNDFKKTCQELGKKYGVYVDVKYHDLSNFGLQDWFSASFEVDRFGGIAAMVSFYEDNLWYENGSHDIDKRIFTRWSEMEEWLCYDIAETEATRHFEMYNCD